MNAAERRAVLYYRLRGYRILATNAWVGGYELDVVARRGRRLVFCEVKEKRGRGFGDPLEIVDVEKQRRVLIAAESWLVAHPELAGLRVEIDAVAVWEGRLKRVAKAF